MCEILTMLVAYLSRELHLPVSSADLTSSSRYFVVCLFYSFIRFFFCFSLIDEEIHFVEFVEQFLLFVPEILSARHEKVHATIFKVKRTAKRRLMHRQRFRIARRVAV